MNMLCLQDQKKITISRCCDEPNNSLPFRSLPLDDFLLLEASRIFYVETKKIHQTEHVKWWNEMISMLPLFSTLRGKYHVEQRLVCLVFSLAFAFPFLSFACVHEVHGHGKSLMEGSGGKLEASLVHDCHLVQRWWWLFWRGLEGKVRGASVFCCQNLSKRFRVGKI